MKHPIIQSSAYALFALLSTQHLVAQDSSNSDQEEANNRELADYVVVANNYEVPLAEVGSTVNVITREELELGQTTFVLDALRELPGVYLRNNGGPGTSFGITTRGLTDAPIILLDGIEVSNPANGQSINPGLLFTSGIERVEFLKGPQSALYGADAQSGVINITTREAKDGESFGTLNGGYGTFNTRQGSVDYQTKQGAYDLSLGAYYYKSDGFSTSDANNEDDGYENKSVRAKFGYEVSDRLDLYLTSYYIDSESDIDSYHADDPYGNVEQDNFYAKTGAILQATEDWETRLSYAYTYVKSTTDSNGYFRTPSKYVSKGERHKIHWRNVLELKDNWTVAGGIEYEIEDNRAAPGDRDQTSYHADNNLELIENLHWTLGGRYDDNSEYGENETWRTTLSYLIEPIRSRLHGSYGTSFIAPNFYQTSNPTYGNPDLDAEEGEGWDFGVETTLIPGVLVLDVTGFRNEIDDQITYDRGTNSYINQASYKSKGVETTLSWQALDSLVISANYTYTDAENKDGSAPLHVPENMANLSATWITMEDKLSLKASTRYIDDRVTYNGDADDYILVDLAAQYIVNERVTLWTMINNVFDEDYQEIAGYNSPDFNITGGLRINF